MKIRRGHVSNSSSCSFIIGLGIVVNEKKFTDWTRKEGITNYELKRVSEISNRGYDEPTVDVESKTIVLDSEIAGSVSVNYHAAVVYDDSKGDDEKALELLLSTDDPLVFWFNDSGDDPTWDEDSFDYNYDDVDLDWFYGDAHKLGEAMSKGNLPGVVKQEYTFGGGRDS